VGPPLKHPLSRAASDAAGVTTVQVGTAPVAVAVSPNGAEAYVANQGDNTVSVLQTASNSVTMTIPVGNGPQESFFSPDGSRAYVINYSDRSVSVVDVATGHVLTTVGLGISLAGVGISADGARLDIGDLGGDVSVLDTQTSTVTATIAPTSNVPLTAISFSADGSKVYELNYGIGQNNGSLDVLNAVTGALLTSTTVGYEPSSMSITPDGSRAVVLNPSTNIGSGSVTVVDLVNGSVVATIPMSAPPQAIAISADGTHGAVTTQWDTAVVFDTAGGAAHTSLQVDQAAHNIVFSHDGSQAYVLSRGAFAASGSVADIDVASNTIISTIDVGNSPARMALNPNESKMYVPDTADNDISVFNLSFSGWHPTVTRLWGQDRYDTAIAVSQAWMPATSPVQVSTLFLASGANFPDALGAAAIAGQNATPLLLTPPNSLPSSVRAEIARLNPNAIDVIGGPSAVSDTVFNELAGLYPNNVHRLQGADRYATDREVVKSRFGPGSGPNSVYVVTGRDFPDALSASAAAAANHDPVVLVDGSEATLDTSTMEFLRNLKSQSYTIVGGSGAISIGVAASLATLAPTTRLGGSDRYATSEILNHATFLAPTRPYFATGESFPDALAGATLAGARLSPLYVVQPTCIPDSTEGDLVAANAGSVTLFGGPAALSANVANLVKC